MIIKNDVIYFKSVPEMFYKERTGIKCNTVRFFNNVEFDLLCDNIPKRIHISENISESLTEKPDYRSFVRKISDISYIRSPDILGYDIHSVYCIIFSWLG